MSKKIEEGPTAHKHENAPTDAGAGVPGSENMPMGMTGTMGGGDPDQKSTHVKPKTIESNLPDGSPRYADPGKQKPARRTNRGGRYEVVRRISTATQFNSEGVATKRGTFEPGDIIELDVDEANSLGDSLKPAR